MSRLGDYEVNFWSMDSVGIDNRVVKGAQSFFKYKADAERASPALLDKLVRQRLTKRLKNLDEDRAKLLAQVDLLNREEQSLKASLDAQWTETP
jgi:uncharacterized protein (DUF3084 family)